MKKTILYIILFLIIENLLAQNNQLELITGNWRFYENCDFRLKKEIKKLQNIDICPIEIEIENGTNYPDKKFSSKNILELYYNKNYSDFYYYTIKKNQLLIEKRLSKKTEEEYPGTVMNLVIRKILTKKNDGFYYYKAVKLTEIKTISLNYIEFGNDKNYSVWKRLD